ncbi:TRAP transporter large permease subunit, partial [Chloroflexota bacterium]
MSIEVLTLLLVGCFLIFIALGLPLVFCLGGTAFLFLVLLWDPPYYQAIYWGTLELLNSPYYISIPLFIFMASMLARSGIAEDLYMTIHRWTGRVAGGLAMGTVFICTILAAMVGLSGAAVITMGITALPSMLNRNYDRRLVIGSISAGATLGILIPPSVLMLVYAMVAMESPARLFLGGIVPGILLSAMFIIYIGIRCHFNPSLGPPLPPEERASWKEKFSSLRAV